MAAVEATPAAASLNFNKGKSITILFEDTQCTVIDEEENRQAEVHFAVVPKRKMVRLCEATAADERMLGHLLIVAKDIAIAKGLDRTGYHVVVDEDHRTNRFKGVHVFGRALHHMLWPTGPGSRL